MATSQELDKKRSLISGLEANLAKEKANGENTRSTEEELRRQYQELENLQR